MTIFSLSCTDGSLTILLGYVRTIEATHIPGVKVIIDRSDDIDNPIKAVWVEIDSLDALLAVKQTLDKELIISGDPEIGWPEIEVYDDWRE